MSPHGIDTAKRISALLHELSDADLLEIVGTAITSWMATAKPPLEPPAIDAFLIEVRRFVHERYSHTRDMVRFFESGGTVQ
jgi:hypothetical protein